jgi:cation transport protein ChaC
VINKPLSRQSILNGHMQDLLEKNPTAMQFMPDDERHALIEKAIDESPSRENFYVFGYGSLIWNPAMHVADSKKALLHGYHRNFCFWSKLGRGTEQSPGLMLGLEPGSFCTGIAYRIEPDLIESEIEILFRREMISYAYKPTWVSVESEGEIIPALTFIVDPDNDRYCGALPRKILVETIALAKGALGRNCDYLFDLVHHLRKFDLVDEKLEEIALAVRKFQKNLPLTDPPDDG